MLNLYNRNSVVFWSEEQIRLRSSLVDFFTHRLAQVLRGENPAFQLVQIEAPLLTPRELINPNYGDDDIFALGDAALRPETTMGSYAYAGHLLNPHHEHPVRLPFVVWQHGKSFRREQEHPISRMRLKEFWQLELQILYATTTKNDYSKVVVPAVCEMISAMVGPCRVEPSDRLPDYALWTQDVVCEKGDLEVCSISLRRDFAAAQNLEVAIGTDRCVYCFLEKQRAA